MKTKISVLIALLTTSLATAAQTENQMSHWQTIEYLNFRTSDVPNWLTSYNSEFWILSDQPNEYRGMRFIYSKPAPVDIKVRALTQDEMNKIQRDYYAIVGEVSYENVSYGSYLELGSYYAPSTGGYDPKVYYSRTLADSGPMGRLEAWSDWREFWLPIDASSAKTKLFRMDIMLHLTGAGKVHLQNLRVVRYPDSPLPGEPPAIGVASKSGSVVINWQSFLLGVAATGASLLFGGGIIFISRRWNRRRHERELRRIASLDS
jgi:hypothetical protein